MQNETNETNETLVFPDHDYLESKIVLSVTDGHRNIAEIHNIALDKRDYAALQQELLVEREMRANAQIALEALAREIVQCYPNGSSNDWGRLVVVARGIVGRTG